MSYCKAISLMSEKDGHMHRQYHDHAYGFPIDNDDELFCRLVLEINQAGLSWTTILHKQQNFRAAYDGFNINTVANYKEKDIERLLNDVGIIRNKLKVNAAIYNAKAIIFLQQQFGSFKNWIENHHPLTKAEWVKLFKKNFKFTGGEIVNEFLMSTGYLPGAHDEDCDIYKKILNKKPAWLLQKILKK